MSQEENRNNRIGLWASLGVHAGLFLVLFFVIAWRAPDPPLPEYGIELNFGLDDQGSGDIQPDEPVGDAGESVNSEAVAEPVPEQAAETPTTASEPAEEREVTPVPSKTESPVTVKETKKPATESKVPAKAESKTPVKENPITTPAETTKESTKEEATKKGESTSQGDDTKKAGDKGSEEGKLDANALYGTPGGGGGGTGMNLQMTGWTWADKPTMPTLPDNENGKIVLVIECDENGDITGITTVERTLSPKAEQLLKDMIRKNSLIRTSGGKVPERSKGTIVFQLVTK
jgi:protein TonB